MDSEEITTEMSLLEFLHPGLRYQRRPVPDSENALTFLVRAFQQLSSKDEIARISRLLAPGDCSNAAGCSSRGYQAAIRGHLPLVQGVLTANREVLELTTTGSHCPRFQFPQLQGPLDFDGDLRVLGMLRPLFRLRSWAARALVAREEYSAAATQLADSLRLADMLCHGEGYSSFHSSGLLFRSSVVGDIADLAATGAWPQNSRLWLLNGVRQCLHGPDGVADTMRVEVCVWALPQVRQLAAAGSLEELADRCQMMVLGDPDSAAPSAGGPPRIPEAHHRELVQRFLFLLGGHSEPFSAPRTVRMLSDRALDLLADALESRAWGRVLVAVNLTRWLRRWRLRRYHQQRRAWPALLLPGMPINPLADDEEAPSSRARLKECLVPRYFDILWPETKEDWAHVRKRLERIRNPVGLLLLDAVSLGAVPAIMRHSRQRLLDVEQKLAHRANVDE